MLQARPKRSCGGDFALCANSRVEEQPDTTVRVFGAFLDGSVGTTRGPFREGWHRRKDEGILDLAVATMLLAQSGKSQGFGDRVPKSHRSTLNPDEPNIPSLIPLSPCCAHHDPPLTLPGLARQARTRAVQGRRRYARARRRSSTPTTSRALGTFSGGGSWAEPFLKTAHKRIPTERA